MFDARLCYSQPITSDIICSRKFHENIKTSLGRNLLRENSASYLTNENGKLFPPFTMKSLPAYLSQLAPMRSRRNRNRGVAAVNGLLPTGFLCSRRSRSICCRPQFSLRGG